MNMTMALLNMICASSLLTLVFVEAYLRCKNVELDVISKIEFARVGFTVATIFTFVLMVFGG